MDKKTIAKEKRELRKSLRRSEKEKYDAKIRHDCLVFTKDYQSFGIYASFNDEVDTFALMKELLDQNKSIALPMVSFKDMEFYQVHDLDSLEKSSFGILEPHDTNYKMTKDEIEVLFIPLSAFNQAKHRIGYGGGYYDRYLKDFKGLKIGLAYSFQECDFDDFKPYDIACDFIITEKGTL